MPNACRAAAAIFNARYYGGDMVVIDSAGTYVHDAVPALNCRVPGMRSAKDSGIEPLIVALGDRHYEVNRPWAADHVTQDRVAGWRSDVATDSADRLYVFNRFDRYSDPAGLPVVTVYERTGQLARTLELPDVADGHG